MDQVLRGGVEVVVPKGSRVSRERVVLVLAYLASRANDDGEAWPSVATMSAHLHIPRSAVQTALNVLDGRYISAVGSRSKGGTGRTTTWRLHIPNRPTDQAVNRPTGRADVEVGNRPTGASNRPTHATEPPDGSGTKQEEAAEEAAEAPPDLTPLLGSGRRRRAAGAIEEWDAFSRQLSTTFKASTINQVKQEMLRLDLTGFVKERGDHFFACCRRIEPRTPCATCDDRGVIYPDDADFAEPCPDCPPHALVGAR